MSPHLLVLKSGRLLQEFQLLIYYSLRWYGESWQRKYSYSLWMNFQSSPFGSYPKSFESTPADQWDLTYSYWACCLCSLLKSRPDKPSIPVGQVAKDFEESLALDRRPQHCMSQSDHGLPEPAGTWSLKVLPKLKLLKLLALFENIRP